ncbi:CRISPR-associated helicase Cas3', partial [bacterium]|nr:CRISPR-associated helicase Cas3' [bacterium]
VSLHDIGKFSSGFQQKHDATTALFPSGATIPRYSTHTPHSDMSWIALEKFVLTGECGEYGNVDYQFLGDPINESLANAILPLLKATAGHHGKPPAEIETDCRDYFSRENRVDLNLFVGWATEYFGVKSVLQAIDMNSSLKKENWIEASWWIAGFIVLCDWIGSNHDFFNFVPEEMALDIYWETRALKSAEEAVKNTGLCSVVPSSEFNPVDIFKLPSLTPLQRCVTQLQKVNEPGLYILEDIMGAGKTEAALALAGRIMGSGGGDGLYFGLPTMATADSMFDRIAMVNQQFYTDESRPNIMLTHSASQLNKSFLSMILPDGQNVRYGGQSEEVFTASAQCSDWLADGRKKALLADIGVGTLDQALLGILQSSHQSLRLLGLLNKVLILDEVHASDAYQHKLTQRLLRFHASTGGSVILLSATLPRIMKDELAAAYLGRSMIPNTNVVDYPYPMVTHVSKESCDLHSIAPAVWSAREVDVRIESNEDHIFEYVLGKPHHCVVWIRNTVKDAIAAYERLILKGVDPSCVDLFHARFALVDRLRIQNSVVRQFGKFSNLSEREGRIVISTQVFQESLDCDMDFMVTDLAPVDLIIQRIGRLQRHPFRDSSRPRPEIVVFAPDSIAACGADWIKSFLPGTAAVYKNHAQLWLTVRWFKDHPVLHIPGDLRNAVEYVYGDGVEQRIPDALSKSHYGSEGENLAKESVGKFAAIRLKDGYSLGQGAWRDDVSATTRLGEPVIRVRIAKWDGVQLLPWADPNHDDPWRMSEVSVRKIQISSELKSGDFKLERAITELKEKWPKKGEYEVVIPLQFKDGEWKGTAQSQNGQITKVLYSPVLGLRYE